MDGIGVVDEAGRFRLLGTAVAGAAFALVFTMLVVSSFRTTTPQVLVSVGLPAAVVGAVVAGWLQLRSWRAAGGYERVVMVERWVTDRHVPAGVPAEVWVPRLQALADQQTAGWGKIVLAVFWSAMTWSMRDQHGPVVTLLLLGLWAGLAMWSALWVIPRARVARSMLQQGVVARD
ncbi:hypothetical protein [Curtobacterium sp. MCBD17_032]|uniref:hypothetical protein n=1 Tax=Curtobacterium sp. MCBD17_032 TaxID=2175659 RepID=UPI000DA88404|nr:hypothetical protein [Curtobacterium sp. MCBD17_032]PZE87084.1 hypothetical protein DEI91_01980 [Curtobacterium sp. MCBD17_032]